MSSFTRTILAGCIINSTIPVNDRSPEQQTLVELWWQSTGNTPVRVPNIGIDLVRTISPSPTSGRQS